MEIGKNGLVTKNNIFLAPMAGLSDLAFRLICSENGAGLVYSEMVSAKGYYYDSKNTMELMETCDDERPVGLQIFGSEPDILAHMVEDITNKDGEMGFDFIDFNMGCPAPKIVKNGDGSALMKEPELVKIILKAIVKASKLPITVKIRKGYNASWVNAVEIAKIAEDAGVSAVCVHGRTREQFYTGYSDLEIIKKVKKSVLIPVIGNGDIKTPMDAKRMLEETNCDGIMVGRGAYGNPWIFNQINQYLSSGELIPMPTTVEKIEMAKKHIKLCIKYKGEEIGLREMRKHLCWYIKGLKEAASARVKINLSNNYEEVERILDKLIENE